MNPLVSVVMITYGHENYIEESINSILVQNFDAEIELIISDDRSPDKTENVVKNIIANHPNGHWIKYVRHNENKGAIPNFVWALSQARGKYIALCEGDDYWIDPLKLKKQVDFLEKNPEYSLTFHKIKGIGSKDADKAVFRNPEQEKTYTLNDLAKGNFIHTPSVIFKKNIETLPNWLQYSPIGDYPLHLLNASHGLIKYFPNEMAVYRVGSGIWSTQNTVDQTINTMFSLRFLLQHFKSNENVYKILAEQYNNFRVTLTKPINDKKALDLNLKDYRYIETIINMSNLLKIIKLKLIKKLNF